MEIQGNGYYASGRLTFNSTTGGKDDTGKPVNDIGVHKAKKIMRVIKIKRMVMKRHIIFLLLLIPTINILSQTTFEDEKFIPSSPTVAELGKYGVIPVSPYTGIPNISIPLFEIKCGQLTLPISLDYHAGGIQVEQIASWVGLGWSLNAGGIISSNIIGRSDFRSRVDIKNFQDVESGSFPTLAEIRGITNNQDDSQPDIYSYNFNGFSGQFVIDKDFTAYEIRNNQQIKIIPDKQSKNFKIIDNNGIIYEFFTQELTSSITSFWDYSGLNNKISGSDVGDKMETDLCTGWFLSRMISPSNIDTIQFVYENELQEYNTKLNGCLVFDAYSNNPDRWLGSSDDSYISPFYNTKISNNTKRLRYIQGNNGVKVVFDASNREDLPNSKRLDEISIFYDNDCVKKWNLEYGYFLSNIENTENISLNKRLKLSSVSEFNEKNDSRKFTFRYFGEDPGEPQMPYRTAYSGSDYWGFLNSDVTLSDATDLRKLFPYFNGTFQREDIIFEYSQSCPPTRTVLTTDTINARYLVGSDKTPNDAYMKTYTLKTIYYPTGGYTNFDYESNDYSMIGNKNIGTNMYAGGLRIKSIENCCNQEYSYTKTYIYKTLTNNMKDVSNMSSGSIINEFLPTRITWLIDDGRQFITSCNLVEETKWRKLLNLYSSSQTAMHSYGGDFIGYSYVCEIEKDQSTRYHYLSINDFPNSYQSIYSYLWYNAQNQPVLSSCITTHLEEPIQPFLFGYWGKSYGRGLLKQKSIFDNLNQIKSNESTDYDFQDIKRIFGMEAEAVRDQWDYHTNVYFHQTGQALPIKKTNVLYSQNETDSVVFTEQYTYNSKNLLSQTTQSCSDGQTQTTKYVYPFEIKEGQDLIIMQKMTDKNMLSSYVDKVSYRSDSKVIAAEHREFNEFYPNIIKPERINVLNSSNTNINSLYPEHIENFQLRLMETDDPPKIIESFSVLYPNCNVTFNLDLYESFDSHSDVCVSSGTAAYFTITVKKIGSAYPVAEYNSSNMRQRIYTGYYYYYKTIASYVVTLEPGDYTVELANSANQSDNPCNGYMVGYDGKVDVSFSDKPTAISTDIVLDPEVYYKYNDRGNIIEIKSARSEQLTSYLWSYNSQYPIAEIKNATYDQVKSALGYSDTQIESLAAQTNPDVGNISNLLRANLPNAQVTTYTYKPLVGLQTMTDPRGVVTQYDYDSYGRLIKVSQDNKVVGAYDYHYKE